MGGQKNIETERRSDTKRDSREKPVNTKGGSITAPLTSCLTGLESDV